VNPGTRHPNGAGGNGAGSGGGFDDFDDFIRDRDDDPAERRDDPFGGFDPYEDYARSHSGARRPGLDRGLIDAVARVVEGLTALAGEALSPELRRQLEKTLRDLLIVLRDVINATIERLERRHVDDFEIEEIPID
jgi:uncharacterized membrane protein